MRHRITRSEPRKTLIATFRQHPRTVAVAVLLAFCSAAASLVSPLIVKNLVGDLARHHTPVLTIIGLAALVLGSALAAAWSSFLLGRVGEYGIMAVRRNIVQHVLRMRLFDVRRLGAGNLVARATTDAAQLRSVTDTGVTALPVSAVVVSVSLVLMGTLDWVLLLIVVGTFTAAGIAVRGFIRGVRRGTSAQQTALGDLAQQFTSSIGSLSTIKANQAEDRTGKLVADRAATAAGAAVSADRAQAFITPLMSLGQQMAIIGVIAGSGVRLASGALTPPNFVAFLMYLFQLISPLMVLSSGLGRIQVGLGASNRIREVFTRPLEDTGPGAEPVIRPAVPALEFASVAAGYDDAEVLHSVSMSVPERGLTAVVGPSGAGKSTLLTVAERFLTPERGIVRLHGLDAAAWPLQALRRRIAYVDQSFTLIDGTIRDNLTIGCPGEIDDGTLMTALDAVGMTEAILALPGGLDTRVGGSSDLSGGQRQRLALARVLLTSADVVLLDEPSSQLDGVNEQRLIEIIDRVAQDRAVVVVAHRLSTVREADQIVVMDAGQVCHTGSHADLLTGCDCYRGLARNQGAGEPRRLRSVS